MHMELDSERIVDVSKLTFSDLRYCLVRCIYVKGRYDEVCLNPDTVLHVAEVNR